MKLIPHVPPRLRRFSQDVMSFVRRDDWERSDGGILIHRAIQLQGFYVHSVNGQDERWDKNLIPDEGIIYTVGVAVGATAKISAWYLALYSGAVSPAANWTAANFTSNATEITSTTEGYSQATRQAFTAGTPVVGGVDNLAAKAEYTIVSVSAGAININGAAMISNSARGGTTGTLISAVRFGATRVQHDTDTFQLGYTFTLTD